MWVSGKWDAGAAMAQDSQILNQIDRQRQRSTGTGGPAGDAGARSPDIVGHWITGADTRPPR